MLGPFWVWLAWGETASARTLLGGGIVLAALLAHLAWTRGGLRRRGRARTRLVETLATRAPAEHDVEPRFRPRAGRGDPARGLAVLDALDAGRTGG